MYRFGQGERTQVTRAGADHGGGFVNVENMLAENGRDQRGGQQQGEQGPQPGVASLSSFV